MTARWSPPTESELQLASLAGELRFVFEQALVDGAELLDIEGGVVDADELAAAWMPVETEGAQAAEEHVVAEGAAGERVHGFGREQIAREGRDAELGARTVRLEETEAGLQREPEVVAARVGEVAFLRETAQARDAVELVVDVALRPRCIGREDQVTLLDHHQEEQPVDEPQELLVVVTGQEVAGGGGRTQGLVTRVRQETVAEVEDRLLDRLAQPLADAGAGVEGVLMVALDQALRRGVVGQRQAGDVEQTIEDGKVGEETVVEDAVEVELEVALLDQP